MASSPIVKRQKKKKTTMEIGKVRTTATISDLPEEILTEVLVRLSAKDILACVCVRRSWLSFIKNRTFITLHSSYHHQINNPRNKKYLLFWDDLTRTYEIRIDDIQCEKYLTLRYPPHLSEHSKLYYLVSNGLICLFTYIKSITTIHVWNPVVQKYKTLPDSPHASYSSTRNWYKAIAFGFVPQIDDYVVVHSVGYGLEDKAHTPCITTCVYSLNTNSWKEITHHNSIPIDYVKTLGGVFVNGVASWVGGTYARGDRVLVCFDTKTEMLREILLPEWADDHRSDYNIAVIYAFDQSIVYFSDDYNSIGHQLGVWVLKFDPMNEFLWEKKMRIELHEDFIVNILGVRYNGEPILREKHDLISYNLDSHKSYDFVKSWDSSWVPPFRYKFYADDDDFLPFTINPFEESLSLLDIDCTKY